MGISPSSLEHTRHCRTKKTFCQKTAGNVKNELGFDYGIT